MSELNGLSNHARPPSFVLLQPVGKSNIVVDIPDVCSDGSVSGPPDLESFSQSESNGRCVTGNKRLTTLRSGSGKTRCGRSGAETVWNESSKYVESPVNNFTKQFINFDSGSNRDGKELKIESSGLGCDQSSDVIRRSKSAGQMSSDVSRCVGEKTAETTSTRRVTFSDSVTNIEALLRSTRRLEAKHRRLQEKLIGRADSRIINTVHRSTDGGQCGSRDTSQFIASFNSSASLLKTPSSLSSWQDSDMPKRESGASVISLTDPLDDPDQQKFDVQKDPVSFRYHVVRSVRSMAREQASDNSQSEHSEGNDQLCGSSVNGSKLCRQQSTILEGQSSSVGHNPILARHNSSENRKMCASHSAAITTAISSTTLLIQSPIDPTHNSTSRLIGEVTRSVQMSPYVQSSVKRTAAGDRNAGLARRRPESQCSGSVNSGIEQGVFCSGADDMWSGLRGGSSPTRPNVNSSLLDIVDYCESPGMRRRRPAVITGEMMVRDGVVGSEKHQDETNENNCEQGLDQQDRVDGKYMHEPQVSDGINKTDWHEPVTQGGISAITGYVPAIPDRINTRGRHEPVMRDGNSAITGYDPAIPGRNTTRDGYKLVIQEGNTAINGGEPAIPDRINTRDGHEPVMQDGNSAITGYDPAIPGRNTTRDGYKLVIQEGNTAINGHEPAIPGRINTRDGHEPVIRCRISRRVRHDDCRKNVQNLKGLHGSLTEDNSNNIGDRHEPIIEDNRTVSNKHEPDIQVNDSIRGRQEPSVQDDVQMFEDHDINTKHQSDYQQVFDTQKLAADVKDVLLEVDDNKCVRSGGMPGESAPGRHNNRCLQETLFTSPGKQHQMTVTDGLNVCRGVATPHPDDGTVRYQLSRSVQYPDSHDASMSHQNCGTSVVKSNLAESRLLKSEPQAHDPEECDVPDVKQESPDQKGCILTQQSSSVSLISHHSPIGYPSSGCSTSLRMCSPQKYSPSVSGSHPISMQIPECNNFLDLSSSTDEVQFVARSPRRHGSRRSRNTAKLLVSSPPSSQSPVLYESLDHTAGSSSSSEAGSAFLKQIGSSVACPDGKPHSCSLNDSLLTPLPKHLDQSDTGSSLSGILNKSKGEVDSASSGAGKAAFTEQDSTREKQDPSTAATREPKSGNCCTGDSRVCRQNDDAVCRLQHQKEPVTAGKKHVPRCRQKIQRRNAFRRSKSTSDASTLEGHGEEKRCLATSRSAGDITTLVGEASLGMSASRSTEALQRAADRVQNTFRCRPAAYQQLNDESSPDVRRASKRSFYASCPDVRKLTGWIAHMFKTRSRDTSLKLLVVPKDEDILQMAYQSSAYRQGKEPYKGSATEIPQPPQLNPSSSQDTSMPPTSTSKYHPTRYKSEIRFIPAEGSHASPNKLAGFDPRQPQQRLSVSSVGSMSSSSSYSTSKDVGMVPEHQGDITMDTDHVEDVATATSSATASCEGQVDVGRATFSSSYSGYPSAIAQHGSSSISGFTKSCTTSSWSNVASTCSSQAPPAAPTRSSSKNITLINFQPSASVSQCQGHSDFIQPVYYNPQMAAPCHERRQCAKAGSLENLERMGDSCVSKNSDSSNSHRVEPPPSVEKLLRTGYETKFRKSARDGLRHSSDNLLANTSASHDWQVSNSQVSSTHLPPGSSTTITLSQQPRGKTTSSLLPPSGRQPSSQWTSDTQVYKMSVSSPASSRRLPPSSTSCSAKDVASSASHQHNGRVPTGRSDSYGLTVSLHIDPRNSNYADGEHNVPNVPRRSERNSVPEHHMINMVSERLKKFESAESIDGGVTSWRQRKQKDYHGYDSVLSRAAEFESRYDDDDRSRRKRSARNSPFSTPAGSTTSLPQALPPPEINKVPPTPPATINFYFREGMSQSQTGSINLEPSPERLPNQSTDGFRMRVSSEPPSSSIRDCQNQERGPAGGMSVSYGEKSSSSPVGRRRPAARQPSYLAAVSPAREGNSTSSDMLVATTTSNAATTPVTFRERSRSEDREARLVRRTSYLLATGRQRTSGYQDPNRVDVSQLVLPPPPSVPTTQGDDGTAPRPRLELPEAASGSLAQCQEVAEPGDSPDGKSPMTPTAPHSPAMDTATTPTKTSNIKKLKNLFGERTPRILEAITDKRTLFDMPSPAGDIRLEGPLLCKIAVTDGKRASDRSWKPCYAQLRGRALFLFKDKNNSSPTPFEDQPISVKSSIVDIAYDYTKKKNVFRLTTYNGSEYLFQADDHDTMLQWIRMIQDNNNPEEDKQGAATSDLIIRKAAQQQEGTTVNKNSPQVVQKGKEKKTSTRSLRSKSPSSHSPAPKPKKQLSEKDLMDPSGQKPKDTKTWKDRMAKKFKRYGSSSSASADMPETSESSEITGTFGVPLEACPCSSFSEYVPLVVEVCTKIVEERGLEYQGIYRVPGNTGAVNILQEELNRAVDYESLELESEKWMDVNVVGSLLKSFFRKLPEPLITEDLYQAMIAANRIPNQEKRMLKIKKLIHDLPEHNFETFRYIAEHLNKVSEKGDLNKMDGRNLAIVFGPTLIRTSDENMVTMVTDMSDQCRIVESIIANYKWFFSSWFEDVNVPVEEQTDTVPVSGMNQELIVKAENLGDRGRDVSVKDLMSSVIQAANRKIRKKDKPKTSDSVDIDMESEPNSYNERNIDREIELRKVRDASQNCLTKEGSVNLDQGTTTTSTTTTTSGFSSISVHESKSSLSLDYGATTKECAHGIGGDLKTSASSLASISVTRSGTSLNQAHEREQWSQADGDKPQQQAGLPIKHYPAYPRMDAVGPPQTENSKPSLLKKYSCDELPTAAPTAGGGGGGGREHDEVKRTYGLTPQTRQHLRRIEQETEALRQRERQRKRNQEHAAMARERIERELVKTRRELEEDHNLDEILARGGSGAGHRQRCPDGNAVDGHSATSDYSTTSTSTMTSTSTTTRGDGHQERRPANRRGGAGEPAGNASTSASRRRSADQYADYRRDGARTGRPVPGTRAGEKMPGAIGTHVDGRGVARPIGDDVVKMRKGSLDSLLDVYDHDISHIDSDVEGDDDVTGKDEGLLESIASVDPQFRTLLGGEPGHGSPSSTGKRLAKDAAPTAGLESNSPTTTTTTRSFRDPTLHKTASGESKVIGIASRFERIKSGSDDDKTTPACKAPTARPWSSEQTAKPNSLRRQDSGEKTDNPDQYAAALRKSTGKLFGSGEDLIDLRSPEEETADAKKASASASPSASGDAVEKSGLPTRRAAGDPRARRRRHTVGGPNDVENLKALMTATQRYASRDVDRRSAWERLAPRGPAAADDDVRDVRSWCVHQRLRHGTSSPAIFDPQAAAAPRPPDGPPTKRKGTLTGSGAPSPSAFGCLSSM